MLSCDLYLRYHLVYLQCRWWVCIFLHRQNASFNDGENYFANFIIFYKANTGSGMRHTFKLSEKWHSFKTDRCLRFGHRCTLSCSLTLNIKLMASAEWKRSITKQVLYNDSVTMVLLKLFTCNYKYLNHFLSMLHKHTPHSLLFTA